MKMENVNEAFNFAVIFDMDGVLIDSVQLNWLAINQVLQKYNIHILDDQIRRYLGKTLRDQVTMINGDYGLELNYSQFSEETLQHKEKLFGNLSPKEGVVGLLDELATQDIPIAVATSTPKTLAVEKLTSAGILSYFPILVTEEDVTSHKPEPDVFLKAAERIGKDASKCIVLEDSPSGITAARAAGMKCVAVQTPYTSTSDLSLADLQISTLSDVNVTVLRRMMPVDFT